jgi:hypothetical protein
MKCLEKELMPTPAIHVLRISLFIMEKEGEEEIARLRVDLLRLSLSTHRSTAHVDKEGF